MEMSGQLHAPAGLSPERTTDTHWIGGWVGSGAGLEAVAKKHSFTAPARNWTPIVQPVAFIVLTELTQLLSDELLIEFVMNIMPLEGNLLYTS